MSRGVVAKARERRFYDNKYQSALIAQFINVLMIDGKKRVAEKIVYSCFDRLSEEVSSTPDDIMRDVFTNLLPTIELKPCRVGGVTYQVPIPVQNARGVALALKWLKQSSSKVAKKATVSFSEGLYREIRDALNGRGEAIKIKENAQRMAEANRAFAHFRWFGNKNKNKVKRTNNNLFLR
ncbi:MAG: ribosomal protein S7 [Candidatus Xenolissoclinum pacificiensis L6]|uniref:Small ribosomal subunit protein uS7 n=1 Tax=Candidatus Xenolissoclinum pacificiensis L6 TaxID=1401685 RepID=W2UYL5_9RICK|nr:MAG: ribosomal protein S7 [Candidatus Xenolissoclinum pacificiensis L6]